MIGPSPRGPCPRPSDAARAPPERSVGASSDETGSRCRTPAEIDADRHDDGGIEHRTQAALDRPRREAERGADRGERRDRCRRDGGGCSPRPGRRRAATATTGPQRRRRPRPPGRDGDRPAGSRGSTAPRAHSRDSVDTSRPATPDRPSRTPGRRRAGRDRPPSAAPAVPARPRRPGADVARSDPAG